MTTYNTGNPIGSTDARDRLDNTENMDILENSTTLDAHPDRLGTMRKTRKGMELEHDNQISAHESEHDAQIAAHESEHDAQIAAHESEHDAQMQAFESDFDGRLAGMAFTRVGSFTTGATLTDMRQVLIWEVSQGGDGHEYGWAGAFPKAVAAGATPATSGGIGAGAWVDRTDATLRSDMNVVVRRYSSVADMIADTSLVVGQIIETIGYYEDWVGTANKPKGGNRYEVVAGATGTADGGSFIALSNGLQAKGLFVDGIVNVCQFGAKGDGVTDDTAAIQSAFDWVKYGKKLNIPRGIFNFTKLVINGNYPDVGGFEIVGDGNSSSYIIRGHMLGATSYSNKITGTLLHCTSSTGGIYFDGIVDDESVYTKQIETCKVGGFSVYGTTSGELFRTRRCTTESRFFDITLVNGGTGYCHRESDCYMSKFERIEISGVQNTSDGLYCDTYRVGGGLTEWHNINIAYCNTGLILGSRTVGASGYGGLDASTFRQLQIHQSTCSIDCGLMGNYTDMQNLQNITFDTCYFELDRADSAFKFKNQIRARFIGCYFSLVNSNSFTFGSNVSSENDNIRVIFDNCNISTPLSTKKLFYVRTGCDAVVSFVNQTVIKNNGAVHFAFETPGTFKGEFIFSGLELVNNTTENLFQGSSEVLRYITYKSPQKFSPYLVTNANLDLSSQPTIPCGILAQTYGSSVNILLPTLANSLLEKGSEITVVKYSSGNGVIIDAGIGNKIISPNGITGQTITLAHYGSAITLKLNFNGTSKEWFVINMSPNKLILPYTTNFTATSSYTFAVAVSAGMLSSVPRYASIIPSDIGQACTFQYNYSSSTTTSLSFTAYAASGTFTSGVKNITLLAEF